MFTLEETIVLAIVLSLYFMVVAWAFIKNKDKLKNKEGNEYYYEDESEEYDYES